jgi:hypothetical protein
MSIIEIIIDKDQIENKVTPHRWLDHGRIALEFIGLAYLNWHIGHDLSITAIYFIANLCIFWFIFGYGLNIARGKPLGHLGKNFIDRLEAKIPTLQFRLFIKALLATYGVYIMFNYCDLIC